uniref:Uncharacterized protein n=1 Tax=Romanomermis culicivorax TaxID=13658 RepID=A0A915I518_ROMCU
MLSALQMYTYEICVCLFSVINHTQSSPETTALEICQPGQTLLWDLLQDDAYGERLSPENEELALQYLQDLFISEPFISRQFVKACLENLREHKSSVISFKLLAKLFHSFRQITSSQQIAAMAFWSDIESNLLNIVLEDLNVWHAHSARFEYGAEIEIKVRLNFLDLIYSNRNFFRCPKMSYENLKTIWDCFDNDDSYREYFYMWLLEQLKNPQRNTVDYETVGLFLHSITSSLNATSLSATGLALLSALLKEDRPEVAVVVLPIIWQVALKNMDTKVAMGAMHLVNNFYVYVNNVEKIELLKCLQKDLFVDAGRHCFLLHILELEDINFATPHNKKLRRIFDELDITPTINVYVKVESEPEVLRFE